MSSKRTDAMFALLPVFYEKKRQFLVVVFVVWIDLSVRLM